MKIIFFKQEELLDRYWDLIHLSKQIVSLENTNISDDNLWIDLSKYFLNNTLKRSNYGVLLEKDNRIIAALFAYIPNNGNLFLERVLANKLNCKVLNDLKTKIDSIEKIRLISSELNIEKNYLEPLWKSTLEKNISSELNMFVVDTLYKGKKLSKILLQHFYQCLTNQKINHFHLFTTSNCDHNYYQKLGMKIISEVKENEKQTFFVYEKSLF